MLVASGNSVTSEVPSITVRFSAIALEMTFWSGAAQRLNSSIATWFGPVVRTICGRSSIAGIDTGPTATEKLDEAVAGEAAAPLKV